MIYKIKLNICTFSFTYLYNNSYFPIFTKILNVIDKQVYVYSTQFEDSSDILHPLIYMLGILNFLLLN